MSEAKYMILPIPDWKQQQCRIQNNQYAHIFDGAEIIAVGVIANAFQKENCKVRTYAAEKEIIFRLYAQGKT